MKLSGVCPKFVRMGVQVHETGGPSRYSLHALIDPCLSRNMTHAFQEWAHFFYESCEWIHFQHCVRLGRASKEDTRNKTIDQRIKKN